MKKLIVALLISRIGGAATSNICYAIKADDIWSIINSNGSNPALKASLMSRITTNLRNQMNLQEHVDGRWRTIKTWNMSIQSTRLSDNKSYQGISEQTYRLYIKFTAGCEVISSYA